MKLSIYHYLLIVGALAISNIVFAYKYFTTYGILQRAMDTLAECMIRLYGSGVQV